MFFGQRQSTVLIGSLGFGTCETLQFTLRLIALHPHKHENS